MATETQLAWSVTSAPAAGGSSATAGKTAPEDLLKQEVLRGWGILSVLSLTDQSLTSGAGFGVNLLLARWMPAELYGAFATAFACFLFVSGFHNVLLLEPMSVFGPSQHADGLPEYFRVQIAIHALLVGGLSILGLVTSLAVWRFIPNSGLIGALLGSSLALPFLLLQWLARRMCYVTQRPSIAVSGSAFYFLFVAAGLFALRQWGQLTPFTTFVLMGWGSALAAAMVVWRLGLFRRHTVISGSLSWRMVLRENWKYGRWLAGSTVLWSIASQAQTFLVAAILGLGAAGILRAMQLPSLVIMQINTAIYLLVLPSMSQEMGRGNPERMRKKAVWSALLLAALGMLFVTAVFLIAVPLEKFLFGGKYAAHASLFAVLGLVPIFTGFSSCLSLALRILQKAHLELLAYVCSAFTSVILAFLLMLRWGLQGAAVSIVGSSAVLAIAVGACFLKRGKPEVIHSICVPGEES